jgi:hypothetical protein
MNAHFSVLLGAYRQRDDGWRQARRPGQCVVGVVGNTVPAEAVAACGALAWRVAPVQGSTAAADGFIEDFSDIDVRLVFARYVEGALDGMDLLVLPRSTETHHKLYLALREARRTGLKTNGPTLWLYDILHTQRNSSHVYGLARTHELLQVLGRLTGQVADTATLQQALAGANATRALLATLQQLRAAGRVTGWQALVATGAQQFMLPEAGRQTLAAWLQDVRAGPQEEVPAGGPRLLVKGAPLDHDRLHTLVQDLGGQIVAEDDDWGSRAAAPAFDVALPPVQALFEDCWRDRPCPRVHPSDDRWFKAALQQPLDGVLFNHARPDDIQGWNLPAERALVEAAGLRWLQLRDDARFDADALHAQLAPFVASLKSRSPHRP